jgi:hypothetical protein
MKNSKAKIFRKNEQLAIELVTDILKAKEVIKNKGVFDWLRGDKGPVSGRRMKLRVDAYFPAEKLVLEYHGKQHFEPNKLMDRKEGRAEQRRLYTELRQKLILKHDLKLLEIRYDEPLTREHLRSRLLKEGYKI